MVKAKNPLKKEKIYLKKKFLGLGAVIVLIILVFTTLSSFSSSYLPLLPVSWQVQVDNWFSYLPIVNKSTRQILARSILETRDLNHYTVDASLTLKQNNFLISFLRLKGGISNSGSLASSYKAQLYTEENGAAAANFNEAIDDFYIKADRNLILPGWALPSTKGWYKIKLGELTKVAGIKTRNDQEIVGDMTKQLGGEGVLRTLLNSQPKLSEETSSGKKTYSLKFSLDKSFLDKIFSSKGVFENPIIKAEINKSDFKIGQVSFTSRVKMTPDREEVDLSVIYKLSQANEKIALPNPSQIIDQPLDLWIKFNGDSTESQAQQLSQAAENSSVFTQNLLTFERLIKVVFLLPKSL